MPARVSAWSIYSVFDTSDGEKVFVGVISEKHWEKLCAAFDWADWASDPRLATNNLRISERNWFLPELAMRFAQFTKAEIMEKCDRNGIPFAPIAKPEDLFEDPQLTQGDNLLDQQLPDGRFAPLPNFPLDYGGQRASLYAQPPAAGEHTTEILNSIGIAGAALEDLKEKGIIA